MKIKLTKKRAAIKSAAIRKGQWRPFPFLPELECKSMDVFYQILKLRHSEWEVMGLLCTPEMA